MSTLMSALFVLVSLLMITKDGLTITWIVNGAAGYYTYLLLKTTAQHRLARLKASCHDRTTALAALLKDLTSSKDWAAWPAPLRDLFPEGPPDELQIKLMELSLERTINHIQGIERKEVWAVENSSRLAGWGVFFGWAWLALIPTGYCVFQWAVDRRVIPVRHAVIWLTLAAAYILRMPWPWLVASAVGYFAYVVAVLRFGAPTARDTLRQLAREFFGHVADALRHGATSAKTSCAQPASDTRS